MNCVMLVEVLDTHGRIQSCHRLTNVGTTCNIGRSVLCDIVLDDPYAAAEHTALVLLEDGRVSLTDLDSRNGTRLDGQRVSTITTIEVGNLIIGRTRLRIRTAHTPLAPERVFRRDLLQRYKTTFAIVGLVLVLGYAAFDQWLGAPEQMAARVLAAMLAVAAALGIWIGLWALVTRIGHGAWTLRTHIAIAANTLAIGAWSVWLLDIATFATQWRWLTALSATLVGGALATALYLHLRTATHLKVRTASIVAMVIPLLFGSTLGWLNQQNMEHDVNRISVGTTVYPPQVRLASSIELADYLAQAKTLKREANRQRQTSLLESPID